MKSPNKIKLLDDIYFFLRKLRLKEYFFDPLKENNDAYNEDDNERCTLNTNQPNPYYNPPKDPSNDVNTYISIIKEEKLR